MLASPADWFHTISLALMIPAVAAAAAYARPLLPWWIGAALVAAAFGLGKLGAFRWDAADLVFEVLQAAATLVIVSAAIAQFRRRRSRGAPAR